MGKTRIRTRRRVFRLETTMSIRLHRKTHASGNVRPGVAGRVLKKIYYKNALELIPLMRAPSA